MAGRSTRLKETLPQQQQLELEAKAKWTTSLTKILVDLMVEQVIKGNKQNRFFSKKAWKSICNGFHKKTGLHCDMEQLKKRHAVLRRQYITIKSLLASKDFRLDESTGVIVAKKESWEKYIKEHPDAETLRSNGCPIYKQLCAIFSESATSRKTNGVTEHKEGASGSIPFVSMSEDEISSSESEEVKVADKQVQNQFIGDSGRKRGRKGIDDVLAKGILEMASASKLAAAAIKKCNERFCITNCIRALDELRGIEEELYFAALDLFNNRIARETFLSLKVDKRLTWLHSKCFTHTNS